MKNSENEMLRNENLTLQKKEMEKMKNIERKWLNGERTTPKKKEMMKMKSKGKE